MKLQKQRLKPKVKKPPLAIATSYMRPLKKDTLVKTPYSKSQKSEFMNFRSSSSCKGRLEPLMSPSTREHLYEPALPASKADEFKILMLYKKGLDSE